MGPAFRVMRSNWNIRFINFSAKYLLSTYSVPDIVPRPKDIAVNKTDKIPTLVEFTWLKEK